MIGHEFDTKLNVDSVKGQAFLVSNDSGIVPVRPGMQIAPNQVLLTNDDGAVVASQGGQEFYIDSRCASCLIPISEGDAQLATTGIGVRFNADGLDVNQGLNLDIADLQRMILEGVDPTELFEETAAGENLGSSNAGFVVIDYLYASSLTEAGFDTAGPLGANNDDEDFLGGDLSDSSRAAAVDIDAAGGQSVRLEVTEGDLDVNPYGVPQTQTFSIEGGTDRLLPGSLQIAPSDLAAFEADLAGVTSNGEPVLFTRQTSVDSDGVGTFTLVGTVNGEVVVTLTLTATQDGNGLSVSASLTQSGPLDHLDSTGTYVTITGDSISIDLPLQVADAGGDLMQSPAIVTLVSNDGQAPVVGDASLELVEPQTDPSETKEVSTTVDIDLGSDQIASADFDVTAAEAAFSGITSHGMPTTIDTSVDGVITIYADNNGTPEKVLEITLEPSSVPGDPAECKVVQYQPIDQHQASDGDADDETSSFTLPFTVTDADGDVSNLSSVTFTVTDGTPALGGERLDAQGVPTDFFSLDEALTPNQYDPSAQKNTYTNTIKFEATSDRLVPDTISIDDGNNNDTLISELKLLSNNLGKPVDDVTITQGIDAAGNPTLTILASIDGEPALEIVLTATQAADGLGMDVDAAFTQYQALMHPSDPADQISENFVSADGLVIAIKLPIQVEDSDGDKLVDPNDSSVDAARVVTFTVVDDDSTTFGLNITAPIFVEESSIDDGTGISEGSKSSGNLNIDTTNDDGDPNTLDADSVVGDDLSHFFFDTDYVVYANGDPVLASGYPVFLEQRPASDAYPKTYFGVADDGSGDNRDVFKVTLEADGTFSFELLSGLDHEPGDGNNLLNFNLLAYSEDADGDKSGNIRVPIFVQDDVPTTQGDIAASLDDASVGGNTTTVDVFAIIDPSTVPSDIESLQGADGAFITRIYNGKEWEEVSTTRPSTMTLYSTTDPTLEIATLRIDPRNEPVGEITFTLNPNLTDPQDVTTETIRYEVTDNDGDEASGQILLSIDIDAQGGQTASLTVVEGDLDNATYSAPDTQTFVIEAGTERLQPDSLQIAPDELAALESELAQITSNGEAVIFTRQTTVDSNGVGTLTLTGTVNGVVVIELVVTATQDGKDLNVSATLTQNAPLDHLSGTGTYVNIDGGKITVNVPLQVTDTGGDLMHNPAQLTLQSTDGAAPVTSASSIDLVEPQTDPSGTQSASTTSGIDLGSDEISNITFDTTAAEAEFAGITSHGMPTTVDTSVDGVITVYSDNNGTPEKVLEITFEPSGTTGEPTFSVTQYQPIDQHQASDGDADDEKSTFTLPYTVTDADGDESNSSSITFNIIDGTPASGGERLDASGAPVDVIALEESNTPNQYDASASENTQTGTISIAAISDRLVPDTISIDDGNNNATLINELKLLSNNLGEFVDDVTMTPSTDGAGNPVLTILASINGEPALQFVLTATQAADGLGVEVDAAFTQYQALIHPKEAGDQINENYVSADGDSINIKLPIQVEDTDGDKLVDPNDASSELARLVTFIVEDDETASGSLTSTDTLTVQESSIDSTTGVSQGSKSSGTLNIDNTNDSGDPNTFDVDKTLGDDLTGYFFETDYLTYSDGQPVLASDFPVSLEQRPATDTYPKTYFGVADDGSGDNRDVFQLTLAQDGTFEFELLSGLDHETGDGQNSLTFDLTAYTVDADGDESGRIRVPIEVQDDIPTAQGAIPLVVDDSPTDDTMVTVDVFEATDPSLPSDIEGLQGADGALITRIHNGVEWVDVSTTRPSTITLYSDTDPALELATMRIDPRNEPVGQIAFTFVANLDNPSAVLNQSIRYEVTDNDGDKAEGAIALTLNDQVPTITIAPATSGVIEGTEDQGQNDTDTEAAGVDASAGIAINVQLNIGDNDLGEAYEDAGTLVLDGEVTLMSKDPSGDIGGKFYFNGTEILPDGDGNIVFLGNMFQASGTVAPIIFDLSGVTFIPDPDYSSYDDTDLIQFDVELELNGHDPVFTSSPMEVTVSGVADAPTITLIGDAADGVFELKEDFNPFGTSINDPAQFVLSDLLSASLQDTDGSETLALEFTLSPNEGRFQGGAIYEDNGVWKLDDPSRLSQVRFIPNSEFSGDIALGIKAISTESAPTSTETAETTSSIILRVEPVADEARMVVRTVVGNEDAGNPDPNVAEGNTISLASAISLTTLGSDADGSEAMFVRIYDIPAGATLQLNDGGTITPITDTDRIAVADLANLELIPPVHSNENITLMVESIVVDSATNSPDDERILPAQPLNVLIAGVADTPEFEVENPGTNPGEWQYDAATGVVTTTVPEDGINGDGLVAVDFTVASGEKALAPTDSSESLTMIVSNLPDGVTFVVKNADGSLTDVELAFAGWATDGSGMSVPTYSVALDAFESGDVYLKLPPNTTEDLRIETKLVATENDGDDKAISTTIEVIVGPPVIDAADTYETSTTTGNEDAWVNIDWQPDLTVAGVPDSDAQGVKEFVVGATISGFADTDSVQLVKGSDVITLTPVSGEVTLTEAQIADGYQLQVKRAPHSDEDLTLTTSVTIRQDDFEGQTSAEKEISGTVNINIDAVVETEDGELQLLQAGTSVTEVSTDSNGRIEFLDGVIFAHPDDSSNETVTRIVITGLEEGFYVENGVSDGQGGWVLNDPNDFSIIAPANVPAGSTTFTISGLVEDEGDLGEGDSSPLTPVSSSLITLNYVGSNSNHEAYQLAPPAETVVVEGFEDNAFSLEAVGDALSFPPGGGGDSPFDQVTVVIAGDAIPAGTVIGGARYHIDNDTYVFEVPGRRDNGNPYPDGLDLTGLTVTPPDDYAGELFIPITLVNVDTRSGDTKSISFDIQLNVKPLVDLPSPDGAAQPSDNTLVEFSFSLDIKETQGLNADQQPLETGETEQVVSGQALEDGLIILSLNGSFADTDQANGEETITAATLTVPAGMGMFVLADGSESDTLVIDASQLDSIKFKPAPDFSGEVEVSASITITDTATTGTDSRTVNTTMNVEVTAVNDEVTFTQNGTDLGDTDVAAITVDEDTTSGASLADLGFSFSDIDGSESLASIIVENVPDGFTLSAPAVNASEGQWIIPASAITDNTSLSQITVEPAGNFSGTVNFTVTVFTQEDNLSEPVGHSQVVSLTVDPVGDGANANVNASASGTEDAAVHLEMEITAKDNRDSVSDTGQPSGVDVTENPPETLLITISGVPSGGKIVLPDGVVGTVTPETSDGGDIVVTIDSSRLDDLTFIPPQDVNGQLVLDLAIQTVDNGAVSTDVVNKQITVNLSAVNDEPVNILADSYAAEEDTVLTITDLQVQDVDARDGSSVVNVQLAVGTGSTLDLVGDSTGISVSGDGTNTLTLTGNIDAINALLAGGVNYEFAGENTSGDDTLTMTTRDRGNFGAGGQKFDRDTVSIVVAPKSDLPELSYATQLASMRAAVGAVVPLLGLMASLVDPIDNEFTLTFSGLGTSGELIDSAGNPVGTNDGSGNWTLSQTELASVMLEDLNLRFTSQPAGDITVTALSDVGDGDPKEASLTINVNVVDTATTPDLNDSDNSSDNLVVDGNQAARLHGGAGDDILVGGLGADILTGGEGDDQMWGGDIDGTGDSAADTFTWKSGDFGTAANVANDVIKDFENGIDVIDLSDAFDTAGVFTFTDLANRLDIQTVGGDTRIQVFDDTSAPIQNILIEGLTLNDLLGMDASGLTQDEILESMLMTGQLVVFDPNSTQFGTEADDTLTASDDGEQLFAGDGDDTLLGGLGNDILVGGAGNDTMTGGGGDDVYAWSGSDVATGTLATDTITDFAVGDTVTGDKLDISAILPDAVGSGSTISELLDYIRPEVTADGLTLHVSQTAGGMEVQDIVLQDIGLPDLGLDMSATGTDILNQLIQQQALKLD
ncbi:retention module-containing protein [Enterovibrio sp. 27052020O]|uniref:retention module-containing protein n=1 Tax=Enterovibrio sp. 27052020O TaxID=3241166 RepID=UPI00388E4360